MQELILEWYWGEGEHLNFQLAFLKNLFFSHNSLKYFLYIGFFYLIVFAGKKGEKREKKFKEGKPRLFFGQWTAAVHSKILVYNERTVKSACL